VAGWTVFGNQIAGGKDDVIQHVQEHQSGKASEYGCPVGSLLL
jgi:hypothetical protein